MRIAGVILLWAACSLVGIQSHAENPCLARYGSKTGEKPLTAEEQVHQLLLQTPRDDWRRVWAGDVEALLRCGARQDADNFFATLYGTPALIPGIVLEADQNSIRVVVNDGGGLAQHLGTFCFIFDRPLSVVPRHGEKVLIRGTYSSYDRDPLQIKMTNSSFSLER